MLELATEQMIENPLISAIIIGLSTLLLIVVVIKPMILFIVSKTATKTDDELMEALYGAIEEHKEEVEAIHAAAKKAKEKKCKK